MKGGRTFRRQYDGGERSKAAGSTNKAYVMEREEEKRSSGCGGYELRDNDFPHTVPRSRSSMSNDEVVYITGKN